jgi:hypothetical protein
LAHHLRDLVLHADEGAAQVDVEDAIPLLQLDFMKRHRLVLDAGGNIATPMMDRFTGGDIQKAIDLEPIGRLGKRKKLRRPCCGCVPTLAAS